MRKFILVLFVLPLYLSAQIAKVEHFNAHTTKATELFELFKTKFKLPVIYDYQAFGNFSSGGLWLGNITMEFVNYEGLMPGKAIFKGIALEPVQHADAAVKMLDEMGVSHGAAVPTKLLVNGVDKLFWTNIPLKDLSSEDIRVFVCDYADRSFSNDPKKAADKILTEQEGGPLGIITLQKIIIGATDTEKALHAWISIPGARRVDGNHFRFFEGPEIVVEKADKDGVKEIVVRVKSVATASKFLAENQLLSVENTTTLIDPEKLFGLRVILRQ